MTLASTNDLLRQAQQTGYGVGAFNVIGIEHAQAIVVGAERERSPVILQLSQNAVAYHLGAIEPIGAACMQIAAAAGVPVGVHLDHATTWELCETALELGFGSVMFDASLLPLDDNVRETAAIAERVHARGRSLEAELGVVGGKEGATSSEEGNTDPDLARWYVEATGIDAIAVAVGSSHYMVDKTAVLDLELISTLRDAVSVPLVLHGSSGVPDEALREAVRRGIVKVNTATELNKAFTGAVRHHLAGDAEVVDPRKYLREAREAMVAAVRHRLQLLGSSGRA
jgi:fructose-bisphosphate aldolase class II